MKLHLLHICVRFFAKLFDNPQLPSGSLANSYARSMFFSFLLILSLFISVRDILEHRISNVSNFALFLLLLFDPHFASIEVALLGIFMTICFAIFSGLGGGDVKLLSLLIMSQGSIVISLEYFQLTLITSAISLVIAVLARRSLNGAVPMAPAILAPFLFRYLAI